MGKVYKHQALAPSSNHLLDLAIFVPLLSNRQVKSSSPERCEEFKSYLAPDGIASLVLLDF